MYEVPLSLSTICQGDLEKEFQEQYPALLSKLKDKDKGIIAINLTVERVKDTSTLVMLGYKLGVKYPNKSKTTSAQVGADGKLLVEKPETKVVNIALFQGGQN